MHTLGAHQKDQRKDPCDAASQAGFKANLHAQSPVSAQAMLPGALLAAPGEGGGHRKERGVPVLTLLAVHWGISAGGPRDQAAVYFSHSVFQSITVLCWSQCSACTIKPAHGPSISVTAPPQISPAPVYCAAPSSMAHGLAAWTCRGTSTLLLCQPPAQPGCSSLRPHRAVPSAGAPLCCGVGGRQEQQGKPWTMVHLAPLFKDFPILP